MPWTKYYQRPLFVIWNTNVVFLGPKSSHMLSLPLRSILRHSMRLRRHFVTGSTPHFLRAVLDMYCSIMFSGLRPLPRSTSGASIRLRSAIRIWVTSHSQRSPSSTISPRYDTRRLSFAIFNSVIQAVVPKPLDWGDATAISG